MIFENIAYVLLYINNKKNVIFKTLLIVTEEKVLEVHPHNLKQERNMLEWTKKSRLSY